jgi:hypothetical protein
VADREGNLSAKNAKGAKVAKVAKKKKSVFSLSIESLAYFASLAFFALKK